MLIDNQKENKLSNNYFYNFNILQSKTFVDLSKNLFDENMLRLVYFNITVFNVHK